jgi:acetyl esterase/lipase
VIPPEHRDKLLIHVHGGCYVLSPGEAGTSEAIMMAGLGHFKVISVDYRMPPEAYFPGALDDAMTVYRMALKTSNAKNVAVFGTSAGGALVLEMMLGAKQQGLRLPGAISPGTPMSDATKTGDSFYSNEMVDNVLVSRDGFCDAATRVYAHGHDLKDPLLSPIYGDMHGFPPAILTTGTRDLLLSNTVRVHRKLREAGVDAQLEVYEGQSHAQYQFDDRVPENREAFDEITAFFDKHLGHWGGRGPVANWQELFLAMALAKKWYQPEGKFLKRLLSPRRSFAFEFENYDWGGDYFRQHGMMMPVDGLDALLGKDAILFGSAGDPDIPDHITLWGLRLNICQGLDQYPPRADRQRALL